MFSRLIKQIIDVLIVEKIILEEQRNIVEFGLKVGFSIIINTITVLIIGSLLDLFWECMILFVSFSIIRSYAGGYHCKSKVACFVLSNTFVILILIIVIITPCGYIMLIGTSMLMIGGIIILLYAPIATENKRLDELEVKRYRKYTYIIWVSEVVVAYILINIGFESAFYAICLGMFLLAILIISEKIKNNNQ